MRILFLSSEVDPFSKTGGLADVAAALPAALARRGHEVVVVSPLYAAIDRTHHHLTPLGERVTVEIGGGTFEGDIHEAEKKTGLRRLFIANGPLYDRPEMYGFYDDNWLRFAFLGRAARAACAAIDFHPQVLHGNDWQCGPAIFEARLRREPRTVFTVHNLAYQGNFPMEVAATLGWPAVALRPEGVEFYGQLSLIKAGLVGADRLTTVSPTYAKEIQTDELGAGLQGVISSRRAALTGILNGIDDAIWDPERDVHLPARYGPDDLRGKVRCKAELQAELRLTIEARRPLLTVVSRLSGQKGFDLLLPLLDQALLGRVQIAILGRGEAHIESALREASARFPQALAVRTDFDDGLAHRLEAGGDFFLMPSRYEPCGLNQMYSMRYGTPPVVRATGGLVDTVIDADHPEGTGFVFSEPSPQAFRGALDRAFAAFARPGEVTRLQRNGMRQDFSWDRSAAHYESVYQMAFTSEGFAPRSP
jgi:starch synthase